MNVPEGFANARFVFSCDGVTDQMGFSLGLHGPTEMDAPELALEANQAYGAAFFPAGPTHINQGWTYHGCDVTKIEGGNPELGHNGGGITGTANVNSPVVNCALLVTKITNAGGRKNRGRMFVPPYNLGELTVNNAGYIDSTPFASIVVQWVDFYDDLVSRSVFPTLFHSEEISPTTITNLLPQNQLATQRRRMR